MGKKNFSGTAKCLRWHFRISYMNAKVKKWLNKKGVAKEAERVVYATKMCEELQELFDEEALKAMWQCEFTMDEGKENPHIQGAVQWKTAKQKFTILNNTTMQHCHYLAPMTAAYIDNTNYCSKQDGTAEWDVWSSGNQEAEHEKKKNKTEAWNEDVNAGMSSKELRNKHPAMWWKTSQSKLELAKQENDESDEGEIEPKTVTVYWGEAGCGKSTKAGKFSKNAVAIRFEKGILYIDPRYNPKKHDTVFLDEFVGRGCTVETFKDITDQGIPLARVLGGTKRIVARKWAITSNRDPETWFAKEEWPMLSRRLTIIKCSIDPNYVRDPPGAPAGGA